MAGKLTKQELKEPDKLQIMLAKGLTYLAENKQKIYNGKRMNISKTCSVMPMHPLLCGIRPSLLPDLILLLNCLPDEKRTM